MNDANLIQKSIIGKILFVFSILILVYLLFSPLTGVLFKGDEFFTRGIVRFPFSHIVTITANDVHPPLYYFILKVVMEFIEFFGFNVDLVPVFKIMSFVPAIILFIISGTYVKREYGWLTAGLLTFCLISMSEFACEYLTIRMYPYACLFLFISFIYAGKIIKESNMKNWILLAIFSCLCAFTHYFAALSAGLIYLGLLIYILFINDFIKVKEFKKWILSVIIAIILYIPWIFPLTQQLNDVGQSYWIPDVTLGYVVNCFAYYATVDSQLYMKAFAIFVLIFFLLMTVRYYINNKQNDDYYILFGFSIFIGTILVGIILSLVYKPILRVRYLLPSVCLIWFGISIYIGKIEDKRLLLVSILLILILGGTGIFGFVQDSDDFYQSGLNKQNLLETIDNENSAVISIGKAGMVPYCTGLSHCDVYTNSKKVLGVSSNDLEELFGIHYFKSDDYDDLIKNNTDKDIYVIQKSYNKFDIGNNSKEIYKIGSNRFFYLAT